MDSDNRSGVSPFRPFGLIVFGDPHLDDDHCDWPTLTRHIDIAKRPGIYGACVGDYRNNWVGRLIRIYADQQVSHPEGQSLAKWFLGDCGVRWAFNLLGNHDMWNEGEAITGLIAPGAVYLAAWEAKVDLRCRGDSWRIHAAHDFKGNSEMNKVHGPLKAAVRSGCEAEVYICGHKHNYASHHFEHEATNRVGLVVRARGYKRQDRHALVNGYPDGAYGHSTMIVVRPGEASPMRRVMHFPDVDAGADYLAFLRGDKVPSHAPAKRNSDSPQPRGGRGRRVGTQVAPKRKRVRVADGKGIRDRVPRSRRKARRR